MPKTRKPKSFDEAMDTLEKIVCDIEEKPQTLEDAFKRFEAGLECVQFCESYLEEVESRIEVLIDAQDGTLRKEDFKREDDQ